MIELKIAKEACLKAGDFLLNLKAKKIISSLDKDIKLQADLDSEKIICEILSKNFSYPILSEESFKISNDEQKGLHWVVDPLDGSLNFYQNIPICCISVALYKGFDPVLGVVYDFNRKEMFSAIVGIGAWLNDIRLNPRSLKKDKNQSILATGFSSYMNYSENELKNFINNIQDFKKVRLLGSAALSLAYVACGRFDAYYEKDIAFWDIAAGIAIIKSLENIDCTIKQKDYKCLAQIGF